MMIQAIQVDNPNLWVLTALTIGTGGSLLIIGSVAGIVAMGSVKQLTFGKYFKIAAIPAFAGYLTAISIWLLEYYLFPI